MNKFKNKNINNVSFEVRNGLSKKEQILRHAPPIKAILYFSIPTITIMLVSSMYNLADKLMAQLFAAPNLLHNKEIMNWYKQIHNNKLPSYQIQIQEMKGYINIATQYSYVIFNLGSAFASLIAVGSSILYSIEYGKRNYAGMHSVFSNGIIFSIVISIMSGLGLFLLTSPNLHSLLINFQEGSEQNPIVSLLAWHYIYVFIVFIPLFGVNFMFMTTLRSQGKTIILVVLNIVSLLLNAFLDFILIKYAKLDLDGAMLATGISWFFNIIVILLIMYLEKDKNLKFSLKYFKSFDINIFKSSSSLGLTPFFIKSSNAFISVMTAYFITHLSGPGLIDAKHTYILQQLTASMMPWLLVLLNVSVGISQGVRVIISYSYGAEKYKRIKHLTYVTFIFLAVWMSLFDILILALGPYMAMAFAFPSSDAFKYRWYIFLFTYSYPFFSITFTMITLFNSIKRPIKSAVLSLLRSAIVLFILSLIGFLISNYYYNNVSHSMPGLIYIIFTGSNDLITLLVILPIILPFIKKYKHDLVDKPDSLEKKVTSSELCENNSENINSTDEISQ